jgi:hypothetical protein
LLSAVNFYGQSNLVLETKGCDAFGKRIPTFHIRFRDNTPHFTRKVPSFAEAEISTYTNERFYLFFMSTRMSICEPFEHKMHKCSQFRIRGGF